MTDPITQAEDFATSFYNIDRLRFQWKASQRFGHNSTQYRIALAAWDEIQEDLAGMEDYYDNPESPNYA